MELVERPRISAVDLFCGAGGLSLGLQQAGVNVVAGIDLDERCAYPYETNLGAQFIGMDIQDLTGAQLASLWPEGDLRLLAGCAPCQPFSSHRRGADTSDEQNWSLLGHFARLVKETRPDFVTMENVTRLRQMPVFADFVATLRDAGYAVDYSVLFGPNFGLPQERRRLVLVASRRGVVQVPVGPVRPDRYRTVREAIAELRPLTNGEVDPNDSLHRARKLSPLNLARMRASRPGGTWADWPEGLRAACHRRASGASFRSFYGRMTWDSPSPTITTMSFNYGTGRFGHPEQDRTLTLRESAMLQGFPRTYRFVADGEEPSMSGVGRLIGNAVPPQFGEAIGTVFHALAARL